MSSTTEGVSMPEVSDHAVQRFIERTNTAMVTKADLAYRFAQGLRVEVVGKEYTEARLIRTSAGPVVLLRQHTHLATVVYAREETVTFCDESLTLECRKCGMKRPDADGMTPCEACKANDWEVIDVEL